jgi:hypothetical protein
VGVGSGGAVLQVEIEDHATVEVTGAVPFTVSAFTRTGMTAPVESENARWFKTGFKN